jgi:mono/diheme cytochrome c family protein
MKMTKLAMLILTIAVALFILIPSLSWAGDDAATLFKTKCAACHGADAAGKPAAKIPSLIGDDAKKASDADLEKAITEKPKHAGISKTLTPDQVKMLVSYIRSVQK